MSGIGYGNSMFLATHGILAGGGGNPPVNTVAPVISGTQVVGSSLSSTTGTWTGSPAPTFTYQWYRGATLITGATSSSYTLVQADAGNTSNITCQVTGTNGSGSATATSNTLAQILDADASSFITSASISDTTQKGAINTLTIDLKGYSIWTKMNAIYPIVGGTSSSHAVNLKTPGTFNLTYASGFTHSSTGMEGNGVSYADTGLIPNSVLSLNNNHIACYSRTSGINAVDMRSSVGNTKMLDIEINFYGRYYSNNQDSYATSTSGTTQTGLFTNSRIISGTYKGYRNTTIEQTNNIASTALSTNTIFIGAANTGSFQWPSSRQYAFASIGLGLSDTDVSNLYTAVQAYQTTLGRQV